MADIEKLSTEAVEKFVLGLLEPLSIWVQAGQDRRNQKADVEAYRKALTINPRRALLPDAHPRLAETLLLRPLQSGQSHLDKYKIISSKMRSFFSEGVTSWTIHP